MNWTTLVVNKKTLLIRATIIGLGVTFVLVCVNEDYMLWIAFWLKFHENVYKFSILYVKFADRDGTWQEASW